MNKSMIVNAMFAMLMITGAAVADTVIWRPKSSEPSGPSGPVVPAYLSFTVIKNEQPEVSGNLDAGGASVRFDRLIGTYGRLAYSSDGAFRYTLSDDWPQVQALGPTDEVKEVFAYRVTDASGKSANGELIINILGNRSVSYDNVEIEINNRSNQATPLNSRQDMRGHLSSYLDRDFFVIESSGNETISLELCPQGTQCFDKRSWVLYVFDADWYRAQDLDDATVTLKRIRKDNGATVPFDESNHMYLLYEYGFYADSLIGIIDPCFGDSYKLDVGVGNGAKQYLVAVSSPLQRDGGEGCSSGRVVLERDGPMVVIKEGEEGEEKTIETTEEYIVAFPNNDDQYTIRATRTGVNPLARMTQDSTLFDAAGRRVSIPKVRIDEKLFEAQLRQLSSEEPVSFEIASMTELKESLSASSNLATYNPDNHIVTVPQLIDGRGRAYSVTLRYRPENGLLELVDVTPVQ